MSVPREIEVKCFICKKKSKQIILLSTNTLGAPDLDLRPSEMQRSTMSWWIQRCPHCEYVAGSISDETPVDPEWLNDNGYRFSDDRNFKSTLADTFYKDYLLDCALGKTIKAFYAALYAAWACDDARDYENARFCRLKALKKMEKVVPYKNKETASLVRADLLRRTGQFNVLIKEYENVTFSDDLLNDIVAFQIKKAKEESDGCYTVDDVEKG